MNVSALKKRIFQLIQIGNRNDVPSLLTDIVIVVNIVVNILCMFLETFDELSPWFGVIRTVETVTMVFFCIEYALRIWTAPLLYPKESAKKATWHFLRSFDGVVDLLTILPFFFLSGFVVFRMLRVVRIFHLFRINGQIDSFNVITSVLYERRSQILSSVFIIVILMFGSSLCMYSAEHEAQPEAFRNAFSGVWWSMSTLLTVGYGDIYPITALGRLMAIVIAFLGVGVVAIPTGIISAGFVEQYSRIKSTGDLSIRRSVQFITLNITSDHSLKGKKVKEAGLPQGLTMMAVIRDRDALVATGDTLIREGDMLVLAGRNYLNDEDLSLAEEHIGSDHKWANKLVKELDISRLTTLVSIDRQGRTIIPHGQTLILPGDVVYTYSKKT